VKKKEKFLPDNRLYEIYKEKFETYKRIYPAVKSIFK